MPQPSADLREELEAAVWHHLPQPMGRQAAETAARHVRDVMTAADAYAEAVADERISGHVRERAAGRERLAEAVDEVRRATR